MLLQKQRRRQYQHHILLNSAYKKIKMNDKKKHLRRCFRIAVHEYKHFTTITSDEQYFLNEKAVVSGLILV